jgi:hypothetical protein
MYAVLDRVTLADLLTDFLRSEKRMGWIQLDMTSANTLPLRYRRPLADLGLFRCPCLSQNVSSSWPGV